MRSCFADFDAVVYFFANFLGLRNLSDREEEIAKREDAVAEKEDQAAKATKDAARATLEAQGIRREIER